MHKEGINTVYILFFVRKTGGQLIFLLFIGHDLSLKATIMKMTLKNIVHYSMRLSFYFYVIFLKLISS